MKKVFYVLAMLAIASLTFSACQKGNKAEENKVVKRMTHYMAHWVWDGQEGVDDHAISYNADGKVAKIEREDRSWTFTYEGNKITAAYVKEGENKDPYVFTLGDNGYVASFKDTWGDERTCEYDAEGHLLKVSKGGEKKSELVWENGNLKKFSRYESDTWQWKEQTFLADDNIGGIFPDCDDKAGIDRWMFEIGLFGKPSLKLLDEAAWDYEGAGVATQTYEKDKDGYVTKVTKVYGDDDPEIVEYKWEEVK